MSSKKPLLFIIFFTGILLSAIFIACFVLPFTKNSRLVSAIAETIIAAFCLMTVVFGVIYLVMKKSYQSSRSDKGTMFNLPATIAKIPSKEKEPVVIKIPMTG